MYNNYANFKRGKDKKKRKDRKLGLGLGLGLGIGGGLLGLGALGAGGLLLLKKGKGVKSAGGALAKISKNKGMLHRAKVNIQKSTQGLLNERPVTTMWAKLEKPIKKQLNSGKKQNLLNERPVTNVWAKLENRPIKKNK